MLKSCAPNAQVKLSPGGLYMDTSLIKKNAPSPRNTIGLQVQSYSRVLRGGIFL